MPPAVRHPRAAITVTAIQTGTANCHVRQTDSPTDLGPLARKLGIMRDRRWAGPLPIYAYLIEHPEGRFLVDTGDSARNSERGYLPRLNPFFRSAVQIRVAPEEELGPGLNALGVRAREIDHVFLTHLHHDHTGGLHHLPHSTIHASAECLRIARRKRGLVGAVPRTWPTWFDPTPYAFTGPACGPFAQTAPLTRDGAIFAVATPGHMAGHVAIVARAEAVTYVLAGDLTYQQELLLRGAVDGVTEDPAESLRSQQAILALARSEPTVLLPAHDPQAAERLATTQTVYPS